MDGNVELSRVNAVIEAVLFAAGHAVSYDKLGGVLGYPPAATKKLVEAFADDYNDDGKGVILLAYDKSCQLCTKEGYAQYIREALGIKRGGNLSPSSLEVLAVVAYNEPVTRSFIDTVRGVDSGYTVSTLADKHLIESCGRLDAPGKPILYRTTPDFLRVFGISSLSELPEVNVPRADAEAQLKLSAEAEPDEPEEAAPDTEIIQDAPHESANSGEAESAAKTEQS